MSHLQRISWIIGGLLLGASALVIWQRNQAAPSGRASREDQPPVEELADHLKEAWAGHHTP